MALNTSDPRVQKFLLVTLLAAGALYAYFAYVFQPKREEIASLETEVKRLEANLGSARAIVQASDIEALRRELAQRTGELEIAEALLPRQENLARLLQEVTLEADRQGLGFALFEPRATIQHELFQERPYQVTLRGGYHQMAMFLTNVASLPQIIKPGAVKLARDTRADSDEEETMTAEMVLTTYLMVPAPPSQDTGEKK